MRTSHKRRNIRKFQTTADTIYHLPKLYREMAKVMVRKGIIEVVDQNPIVSTEVE